MNEKYTGYQYKSDPASADLAARSSETTSSSYENMSSGEIRGEIAHTRNELSDTLDAILRKLSPNELVNQAIRYLNGPKVFASNLGNTVKEIPLPVALLGVGLAWLMASSTSGKSSRTQMHEGLEEAEQAAQEGRSRVKEKMGGAVSAVREKIGDVSQSIKETTDKVKEKVWSARDKAQQTAQQTREKISGTAAGAGQQASRLSIVTRNQAQRVKSGVTYLWNEQPFVLAAMGFAIGAALGMSLPHTRLEDEAMGQRVDQLKEQAKETWEQGKETVKEVAQSAQETVASSLESPGSGTKSEGRS